MGRVPSTGARGAWPDLRAVWARLPRLELLRVIRDYRYDLTAKLLGDLAAGIVVAVMLIPQGMAYGTLSGVPPKLGLTTSIFALLMYAPFSTSPQLAVGPVAMLSLLSNAAVSELAPSDSCYDDPEGAACQEFIVLSRLLTFLVGSFSLVMGLLRAGYLVNFMSHPVLKGFTLSAALIIGSSQLSKVLGFRIPRRPRVYDTWIEAGRGIAEGKVDLTTFILFIENMAFFYGLRYARTYLRSHPYVKERQWLKQVVNAFPSALVVVVTNILLVSGLGLQVSVVGDLSPGLDSPVDIFTGVSGSRITALIPSAFIMALVGFMESISVAKAMALRFGNVLDSDQELIGLGAANMFAAFFSGVASTGGLSRTPVNADAGAKTPLAGVITAVVLIVVVSFLADLFRDLPNVTLGSMIIFAVTKLIDMQTPRMLWAVDRSDLFVYAVTSIATLLLGIELGVAVGATISLVMVIKEAALPHAAELGKMPGGSRTWRNVKRFPGVVETLAGIRVFRFDAPLFFANAGYFKDLVLEACRPDTGLDGTHKVFTEPGGTGAAAATPMAVIVDCSAIGSIDSSAIDTLESLPDEMRKQAQQLKERRLLELRKRLKGLSASERLVDEVSALRTPEASHVDQYHPSKPDDDLPCLDSDLDGETDAVVVAERIRSVVESPPRIPVLFLTCMRGPVRDAIRRNDVFEDFEEARELFSKGNVWRCEHPCRCVGPHRLLCLGCRTPPGFGPRSRADGTVTKLPSGSVAHGDGESVAVEVSDAGAAAAGKGGEDEDSKAQGGRAGADDDDAGASRGDGPSEDAGAVSPPMRPRPRVQRDPMDDTSGDDATGLAEDLAGRKYPLMQLVLQDQDIDDAATRVRAFLRDMRSESISDDDGHGGEAKEEWVRARAATPAAAKAPESAEKEE